MSLFLKGPSQADSAHQRDAVERLLAALRFTTR
jgi:hypothetical protein